MKLIFAFVCSDDAVNVQSSLTSAKYSVTCLSATGGFLKAGSIAFLCVSEDDKADNAIEIIKQNSQRRNQKVPTAISYGVGMHAGYPPEAAVGGADIFVVDAERFEKV